MLATHLCELCLSVVLTPEIDLLRGTLGKTVRYKTYPRVLPCYFLLPLTVASKQKSPPPKSKNIQHCSEILYNSALGMTARSHKIFANKNIYTVRKIP